MAEAILEICNKKGLHARAAAKFVKVVAAHSAQVRVSKLSGSGEPEGEAVTGSSILGLMMFGADKGTKLKVSAEGEQAGVVVAALKELVENKFGEGE
ncbi:MAG: HPr family phosphocarrier protein [Alphaproteobacteria bacterium]|nr:HPr family phosphocarrier protein [Alphaproteobacteria bacterium]